MARVAERNTYAYAAMGHGIRQRRFVKGGDVLPFGLEPVDAEDFRETDDEPAVVTMGARKPKPAAEQPLAEGDEEHEEHKPARGAHPARRRAVKDDGQSGKEAD